jgi:hypothetical protein
LGIAFRIGDAGHAQYRFDDLLVERADPIPTDVVRVN